MSEHTSSALAHGAAQGPVRGLLRAEGLALLVMASAAYAQWSSLGWGWFFALFLLPDLAFLGYVASPRMGAICYNATHSTLGAWALLAWGVGQSDAVALSLALIWLAHIGFDRALGYGLKYAQGFGWTHLGRMGRTAQQKPET